MSIRFKIKKIGSQCYPTLILLLCTLYFLRHTLAWFEAPTVGNLDWDFNLFYLEIFNRPLRRFHQLPLWNPYSLGGFPLNIHPGIKSFSPDTLLSLLFGTLTGAKLTVLFHYGVGYTGAWYLTRRVLGLALLPVLLFSFFWLYSGWLPLHLYAGHANFSPILYAPFVVAFFIRAVRRNNYWFAITAGFVLEIMLLSAAFYAVVYILIAGGVYVFSHELLRRPGLITGPSTVRISLLTIGAFLILSAHRWIPLLVYATGGAGFHHFPDESWHSLAQVWQMFTDRTGNPEAVQWAGQSYLWWEYGNYTGAYFWILLIGLSFFIRRGDIPIVIVCCALLLLLLGNFAQLSPYNLMRVLEIPVLRHLRVPSRWSMPLLFVTALLGAIWLQRAIIYTRNWPTGGRRAIVLLTTLFLAYSFYDLQIHNTRFLRLMFQTKAAQTALQGDPIRTIDSQKVFGTVYSTFPAVRHNLSVHTAPEMLALRPVGWIAEDSHRNDEFRLSGNGQMRLLYWSPNEVHLHILTHTPARLVYNQRYQSGWRADDYEVEAYSELISIELPAGEHTIRLRYTDSLYLTLLLLCGGLHVLCIFVWLHITNRVRKSKYT